MVERLAERVAHPLRAAVAQDAKPFTEATLQPPALDLETQNPAIWVAKNEVAFVVPRALGVVAIDHAGGVEYDPVVRELVSQRIEDLALRRALEILVEKRI